jgi:hypothetical protein
MTTFRFDQEIDDSFSLSILSVSRLEGSREEWLQFLEALKANSNFTAKRLAIVSDVSSIAIWNPRNSTGEDDRAIFSDEDRKDLAQEIQKCLAQDNL